MPPSYPDPYFPCPVLIDTREQLPYRFAGIPADAAFGGGIWQVPRRTVQLPTGDYSLDGYASRVAVERKSISDLFGTLGQGRDRFIRELERLNEMPFACVVVEAEWSEIFDSPPEHSRLEPRTVWRSVLAWMQRFPRVHWLPCPGREFAEVATLRILERFLKEQADVNFRKQADRVHTR